jgi:hypothetical protein
MTTRHIESLPQAMLKGSQVDPQISRPHLDRDIVCVGFRPARVGFLTTLEPKQ